jgi:protein-arginine kinase activator protein McsA
MLDLDTYVSIDNQNIINMKIHDHIISDVITDSIANSIQKGGNLYKQKYLKYKQKYLELKYKLYGNGKKNIKCNKCGSEWIYTSKKGQSLCEECYNEQNQLVREYHKIQNDALEDVKINNIIGAIDKLRKVIILRNKVAQEYFPNRDKSNDRPEMSHEKFANEILPNLIKDLQYRKDKKPIDIWNEHFAKLNYE